MSKKNIGIILVAGILGLGAAFGARFFGEGTRENEKIQEESGNPQKIVVSGEGAERVAEEIEKRGVKEVAEAVKEKEVIKEPIEIQKTRSVIENLKNFLDTDARRAILVCADDPCRIETKVIEEYKFHWDCGGRTLVPAPNVKTAVIVKADSVSIENCVFKGFDTAIEVEGSNAVITKTTIKESGGNGILMKGVRAAIFENSIEENSGAGIFVAGESNEHAIVDNALKMNGLQGLHISGAGAVTVAGNAITGNKSQGVWLSGYARDNLLHANTIRENGGDCGIFLGVVAGKSPKNNRFIENVVDKTLSCE